MRCFRLSMPCLRKTLRRLYSPLDSIPNWAFPQAALWPPSLALDLMKFRPLIADSVVLTLINNGGVRPRISFRRLEGVALTQGGRIRLLWQHERRMRQEIDHPVFGYRISYRRVLEVQARLWDPFLWARSTSIRLS